MSVTLKTITLPQKPQVTVSSPYIFTAQIEPVLRIIKADVAFDLKVTVGAGFKTDGASVPALLRWFLPGWAQADGDGVTWADIYNMGATIHDALYIKKGAGIFSREECDDILRGIWRNSGISRFKAGVADWTIGLFAGGKKHWGNDSYGVGSLVDFDY